MVTLLNASDSEEDISEEENHTNDDSIHPTSESDCDISDSEDDRDNVHAESHEEFRSIYVCAMCKKKFNLQFKYWKHVIGAHNIG